MNIKICGITEIETLNFLIEKNVNYAGFIFHKNSPRNVTNEFLNKVRGLDFQQTRPVCVFVNSDKAYVRSVLKYFEKPIIQFHGNESEDFCKSFGCQFWKALRVKDSISLEGIKHFKSADAILLDTYKKDIFGGTGSTFDWNLIPSDLIYENKLILSGGLTIENLKSAFNINPWCLDFNSGVESAPGLKDHLKVAEILSFIRRNGK
ncbi:MAG: hypothetical protein CL851_01585 [Crocinitomicaceae bacterium]|nr:hypothetical protein [Crocinitomicaceae bacterium]|tara:strand:- start:6793 stop:7410 length:618 start_codon:yes stop_codon:yes gene_type:complete